MILRIQVNNFSLKGVEEVMAYDLPNGLGPEGDPSRRTSDCLDSCFRFLVGHPETATMTVTFTKG